MLVQEFAERLLLGPNLEDKLFFPDHLKDAKAKTAFLAPELPARSDQLSFVNQGKAIGFSEFKSLKCDEHRGHCLHFFANHELQAIELMALFLLKFPDAPNSLRRQIISAIQDEQKHTKLYIARMNDCGIAFGQDRLNRFFWDALKNMDSVESFLAGMSLTLEQANLDFAYYFKQRFSEIGDESTSKVLGIVLEDEQKHVRLGLEYFKKHHADEEGSIWDAYCHYLQEPLYPSRAKADPFQIKIRQELGFNAKDLNALMHYQRSKGRPPELFIYNSFLHDFKLSTEAEDFRSIVDADFQYLPLWFCKDNDVLVVNEKASDDWLSYLKKIHAPKPEIITVQDRNDFKFDQLGHKHIVKMNLWSPHPGLGKLIKECDHHLQHPHGQIEDQTHFEALDSKCQSHQLLTDFYSQKQATCFGHPQHTLGFWVVDQAELTLSLEKVKEWGFDDVFLKAPYGCAGQSIKKVCVTSSTRNWPEKWVKKVWSQYGKLWVQPAFQRLVDLSLTGCVKNGQLKLDQVSHAITNQQGKYCGHVLSNSWSQFGEEIRRFLLGSNSEILELWKHEVNRILAPYEKFFFPNQNLAIDSFVYRDLNNNLKINPICELNTRTTFGHLALKLSEKIASNQIGIFWLNSIKKDTRVKRKSELCELYLQGDKWSEGIIHLSDPSLVNSFEPLCIVAKNLELCYEKLAVYLNDGDGRELRSLTPLLTRLKMDSHTSL